MPQAFVGFKFITIIIVPINSLIFDLLGWVYEAFYSNFTLQFNDTNQNKHKLNDYMSLNVKKILICRHLNKQFDLFRNYYDIELFGKLHLDQTFTD